MGKGKTKGKAGARSTVRVDPDVWRALRVQAVSEGRSTGDVLADAIRVYIKQGAK